MPRGESLFDMHFDMKLLRFAPVSFWLSAPKLQVSIFCCGVAVWAAAPISKRDGKTRRNHQSSDHDYVLQALSAASMSAM